MLRNLDTPLQRAGTLLVAAALLLFVFSAVLWNFHEETFFSHYMETRIVKLEKPKDRSGHRWEDHDYGWREINALCASKAMTDAMNCAYPGLFGTCQRYDATACSTGYVPHEVIKTKRYDQSITDFLWASFHPESIKYEMNTYFAIGMVFVALILIALLMFAGALDSLKAKLDQYIDWLRIGSRR